MTLPCGPIISLILSGSILNVAIFGAHLETSFLGSGIQSVTTFIIFSLAEWAWTKALRKISSVIPLILISICKAVIPSLVPATLKSISPKWSSKPWISVNIVYG